MPSNATAKVPRVKNLTIDLSQFDNCNLSFVNADGRELLALGFDRSADEKPQLKVDVMGPSGNLQSTMAVFDVDA